VQSPSGLEAATPRKVGMAALSRARNVFVEVHSRSRAMWRLRSNRHCGSFAREFQFQ